VAGGNNGSSPTKVDHSDRSKDGGSSMMDSMTNELQYELVLDLLVNGMIFGEVVATG
jgi:hypothetical protein